jgi:hypothetical protein
MTLQSKCHGARRARGVVGRMTQALDLERDLHGTPVRRPADFTRTSLLIANFFTIKIETERTAMRRGGE